MRWTGVRSMQAVDDVQSLFVRFERADWFWKFLLRQRTATAHPVRNAGLGIEALILHKENDSLERLAATTGTR